MAQLVRDSKQIFWLFCQFFVVEICKIFLNFILSKFKYTVMGVIYTRLINQVRLQASFCLRNSIYNFRDKRIIVRKIQVTEKLAQIIL